MWAKIRRPLPKRGLQCLALILAGLLAAACEPKPTPFPVDIPLAETATPAPQQPSAETPELTPQAAAPGIVRYALDANAEGLVADLDSIRLAAQVEQLAGAADPDDLGTRYDIIAAYGDLPGGQRSPVVQQIALVINPALPPTSSARFTAALRRSLGLAAMAAALLPGAAAESIETVPTAALRAELANAGWPDGADLTLVYAHAPGASQLAGSLDGFGLVIRLMQVSEAALPAAVEGGQAHLALVAWTTPDERAAWVERVGDTNVADLYSLPIGYLAVPGLNLSFTPSGWPLPQHP